MRFKDWYVENRKGFIRDVGKLGIFWAIQNLNKKYAEDSKAARRRQKVNVGQEAMSGKAQQLEHEQAMRKLGFKPEKKPAPAKPARREK